MALCALSLLNTFWFIFFSLIGMVLPCTFQGVVVVFITRGLFRCMAVLPGRRLKNGPVCGQARKGLSGPPFLFGACAAVCETRPGPRWALSTCNEQLWVLTQQAWPCSGSTTALRRDPRLWVTRFLFSLASAVHISSSFQGESITEGAHKLFNMN